VLRNKRTCHAINGEAPTFSESFPNKGKFSTQRSSTFNVEGRRATLCCKHLQQKQMTNSVCHKGKQLPWKE